MSRSLERSIECCKSQARTYSSLAGIELRPSQIQKYVDLRIEDFTQDDHVLLDTLLDEDQRVSFRAKYEFIFGETPPDVPAE